MTQKDHRALLIDPAERSIKEITINPEKGKLLQELVGVEGLGFFRVEMYEHGFDEGVCDDLGLARGEPVHAFQFTHLGDPIAGKCVVFGADRTGATKDATMTLECAKRFIRWLGVIKPKVVWEHTAHGASATVSYEVLAS